MKFRVFLGAICALIILAEALATNEEEEHNSSTQNSPNRMGKETILATLIPAQYQNVDVTETQTKDEKDPSADEEENDDMSENFIAVGPNFANMAALIPANLTIIQAAGIAPKHVIGYVPVTSANGAALVFPAGGVRVVNPDESIDLEEEEIARAVRRSQNVMRRNPGRAGYYRRRNGYPAYGGYGHYGNYNMYRRGVPNYWRRRRPSSTGRRRTGNKKRRSSLKRQNSKNI